MGDQQFQGKKAGMLSSPRKFVMQMIDEALSRHQAQTVKTLRDELGALQGELATLRTDVCALRGQIADDIRAEAQRRISESRSAIGPFEMAYRRNLQVQLEHDAVRTSADLVRSQMSMARPFSHPPDLLAHSLSIAPSGGMALEFGVFMGTTLRQIAESRAGQLVFGFDSFEGLPEAWRPGFPAGAFAVEALPEVPGAELVKGWFDQTLPAFLDAHPGPVDFLHVDCDLYSSTTVVLDLVGPRLRGGSVIVFDEFFNYSGWEAHEYRAWSEYVAKTATRFRYEAYMINNEQVAVQLLAT